MGMLFKRQARNKIKTPEVPLTLISFGVRSGFTTNVTNTSRVLRIQRRSDFMILVWD